MLRPVALARTDVLKELSAFIVSATRISELGTTSAIILHSMHQLLVTANAVPSSPILVTLMTEALSFSETSVPAWATRRNIPEDGIITGKHISSGPTIKRKL
jgi:hypothetical protein